MSTRTEQQPNGEEAVCIAAITLATAEKKKKEKKKNLSFPPDGYVCKVCDKPGHWIQQCPDPKKNKNMKKKSNKTKSKNASTIHVPVPGVDPSKTDIEKAKQLQKLKPPMCFCRIASRLKKVKRSFATANEQQHQQQNHRGQGGVQGERGGYQRVGGASTSNTNPNFTPYVEPDYEQSRAIGNYFFFCAKKKKDVTKCRFARPVQDHEDITPKAQRPCAFFVKYGRCKKGDACAFLHEENEKSMQYAKENTVKINNDGDDDNEDNKKRKRKADDSNNIDNDVAVATARTIEDCDKSNNKKKTKKKENSTTTRPIDNEKPTVMRGGEGGSSDSDSDSSSDSDSDHNTTEIKETNPTTTIIRSNSNTSSSDNYSESTSSDGSDDDDDDE